MYEVVIFIGYSSLIEKRHLNKDLKETQLITVSQRKHTLHLVIQ